MKKFLRSFNLMVFALMAIVTFTACSSDDDNTCYFTLGVENLSISGSTDDITAINAYMNQVSDAYYQALGMSDSNNSMTISGDYKTLKSQMKSKFESAQLPSVPSIESSYSFTIALRGCDLSKSKTELEDMDVVASKTFSN